MIDDFEKFYENRSDIISYLIHHKFELQLNKFY